MSSTELEEYLASEEELLLSFSPESIQDEDTDPDLFSINDNDPVFGATDRRILYSSGGFKDIEYSHISSIENQTKTEAENQNGPICTGICGGIFLLSGVAGFGDNPLTALFGLLLGGGLLIAAYHIYEPKAESDKKEVITLITGDETDQQIEVTALSDESTNIGAELSRIVREQR
jgi:hypothetical protein